jgi:hypothetical protein
VLSVISREVSQYQTGRSVTSAEGQGEEKLNRPRRSVGARLTAIWEKSAHVVIVSLLFMGVCLAALSIGRGAVNGFLLMSGTRAGDGAEVGEVLFVQRDGLFCRHMTLDNESGVLAEHTIERCPAGIGLPPQVR